MAASSTIQSAVMEKVVVQLLEQLTATQPATRPPAGMLVLLREDNLPPMSWRLAVISETFPGLDGHVRVVKVKTSFGQLKRPIHKSVVLPVK